MENKKVNIVLFIVLIAIIVAIIVLIGKYNEQIAEKAQDIIQNTIAPVFTAEDDGVKIVPTYPIRLKEILCGVVHSK